MICRTEDRSIDFPVFKLSNKRPCLTHCVCESKIPLLFYHWMHDRWWERILKGNAVCRMMYMQVNILLRKFSFCSDEVKVSLFEAYCTHLYTAHLWCNYRASSLQKLQVAYNDAMRILLRRPRWHGASEICVSAREITLKALLRNIMYRFICRLKIIYKWDYRGFIKYRVSTTRISQSCGDTVIAVFCNSYFCDRCYGL